MYPSHTGSPRNPRIFRSIAEHPCRKPGNCMFWGVGCPESLCQCSLPHTLAPEMCIFGGSDMSRLVSMSSVLTQAFVGILGILEPLLSIPAGSPEIACFGPETLCQRSLPYTLAPEMCIFLPRCVFNIHTGSPSNPGSFAEFHLPSSWEGQKLHVLGARVPSNQPSLHPSPQNVHFHISSCTG